MMQSWVARVQLPGKQQFWAGDFQANGRTHAKQEAKRFVSAHLPMDTLILGIALGTVHVTLNGPEIAVNETCAES